MALQLTGRQLAEILDVSPGRVSQLATEGKITRLSNGKYPAAAITQYVRFLRDQQAKPQGGTAEQLEAEKLRKIRRENDIEEGKFAPLFLLTDALQKSGAIIIANLESLPLLMKRHWPEITGDQITMVKRVVAECRNTIADMKIDMEE